MNLGAFVEKARLSTATRNKLKQALVDGGFAVSYTAAEMKLWDLDGPRAEESWFSNGVVEFKLVRRAFPTPHWDYHNFRNLREDANLKRVRAVIAAENNKKG